MSDINYEQDQRKDLDSVNESGKLSDQVVKLTNLEDELANKEKELKELKRKVELVSGEIIPTMMQEMNISTLKLADGTSVEVKPVYGASILVAKREGAFKWLRDNGLGDLIKNEVTVALVVTKTSRLAIMQALQSVKGMNLSRNSRLNL